MAGRNAYLVFKAVGDLYAPDLKARLDGMDIYNFGGDAKNLGGDAKNLGGDAKNLGGDPKNFGTKNTERDSIMKNSSSRTATTTGDDKAIVGHYCEVLAKLLNDSDIGNLSDVSIHPFMAKSAQKTSEMPKVDGSVWRFIVIFGIIFTVGTYYRKENRMKKGLWLGAVSALLPAVSIAGYATNVWKTPSGGSWQDADNWSDSTLVSSACYVDLSALDDGAVITSTSQRTIWGIIATNESATVKTITIKRTSEATLFTLAGPSSSFKATDFKLKNVRLVLAHDFVWATGNSDNIRLNGCSNGTLVLSGKNPSTQQWNSSGNVNIQVIGADNYLELASKRAGERVRASLSKGGGIKLSADAMLGAWSVANTGGSIYLNGHTLTMGGYNGNSSLAYDAFKDSGFLSSANGRKVEITASQTGTPKIRSLDGQLTLAASAVKSSTALVSDGHGEIALGGSAAVATLESINNGMMGAVKIPADAELTVNGTGMTTSTVYRAKLTGDGGFVKGGEGYTLTLQGANDYKGATKVKAGSLVLSRPYKSTARGLIADWRFDDPTQIGHDSSGNGVNLGMYNDSSLAAGTGISIVDDPERGKVVKLDNSKKAYLAAGFGSNSAFPTGDAPYTVSFWAKSPSGNGGCDMLCFWGSSPDYSAVMCTYWYEAGMHFENRGNGKNIAQYVSGKSGETRNFHDDKWHHIVHTYDSGVRRVYIDGVMELDDTTGPLSVKNTTVYLGWGGFDWTYWYFDGCYDDVRIYSFALSGNEVTEEYTHGTRAVRNAGSRFSEEYAPKPVAHYTFEDETNIGKDVIGGADMTDNVGDVTTAYDAERGGRVLDLSASTLQHLTLPTMPDTFPTGDSKVSISCWVRPYDGFKTADAAVFHYGNPTKSDYSTALGLLSGDNYGLPVWGFAAKGGKTEDPSRGIRNTADGQRKWFHVTGVMETGNDYQRMYIDGTSIGTTWFGSAASVTKGGIFRLGNRPDKAVGFQGWIDDVRVYDKVLSQNEIHTIIAEETAKKHILPQGTDLTVDAGATVTLNGVSESIGALNGEGTVKVMDGSELEVTGDSVFDGTLNATYGWVLLGSGGSIRRTDGAAFGGDFAFTDGVTIKVGSEAANLPIVKTTGSVSLPATGTVTLAEGASVPPVGRYVLVDAGRLSAPSGLTGWTVSGELANRKCRLSIAGNQLMLSVRGGLMMIFK